MRKEISVLYSNPMVKAILDDRKLMTRRILKINVDEKATEIIPSDAWPKQGDFIARFKLPHTPSRYEVTNILKCPYGKKGDIHYVKESHYTYGMWYKDGVTDTGKTKWRFKTKGRTYFEDTVPEGFKFYSSLSEHTSAGKLPDSPSFYKRSSLFLPKKSARIWLEVTDVRVERLNNITEEDAIIEGVEQNRDGSWHDYISSDRLYQDGAKPSFISLWLKINGEESWQENPWVWVVSFKVLSKTGKNIKSENGKLTVPAWSIEYDYLSQSPMCKK